MTWTAPTAEDFLVRFPEFDSVDEETIQAVLDEAVGDVGDTWVERDRTPGVLHLTAHLLVSQGLGDGASGGGAVVAGATGGIKSRTVGDAKIDFAESGYSFKGVAGSGPLGLYYTTVYGRRYLELLRRNFPAVAVV